MSDEQSTPSSDSSSDSETSTGAGQPGISDEELPADVRPSDDNPLAKGPTDADDEDEGMSLGGDDLGA